MILISPVRDGLIAENSLILIYKLHRSDLFADYLIPGFEPDESSFINLYMNSTPL